MELSRATPDDVFVSLPDGTRIEQEADVPAGGRPRYAAIRGGRRVGRFTTIAEVAAFVHETLDQDSCWRQAG